MLEDKESGKERRGAGEERGGELNVLSNIGCVKF